MDNIIATCGHPIDRIGNIVSWKEHDFDLGVVINSVAYGVLCDECLGLYKLWGILLETEEDERAWIKNSSILS